MTRGEFIKMCSLLGIGLPMGATAESCGKSENPISQGDKVIIIGAGAGGLTAGYLLQQRNIDFEILEASSLYGGRMKRTKDFADFPIPLGGEWLHVGTEVLREIVNDASIHVDVTTIPYDPHLDFGLLEGKQISIEDAGFATDQKFINSSWFDFFEEYIVSSIQNRIRYNNVIESIDYSGSRIVVKSATEEFIADRVIVSVPVKILQEGLIRFLPMLPADKVEAIKNVRVWDGCKAFIEFSEKFYPSFIAFDIQPESAGQKLYYDASYGQDTSQHILGLFAVGVGTIPYAQLPESELIDFILSELDEQFDGKASKNYVKHIFQNWNEEPYALGAYVIDQEDWRRIRTLGESVEGKLYFAGDAYTTGEDWSSVHTAARSALRAVMELVG